MIRTQPIAVLKLFLLNLIKTYFAFRIFSYFPDECDDETCQDLSEINENTHTQIDTGGLFSDGKVEKI